MKFLVVVPHYGSDDHLKKLLPSLKASQEGATTGPVTIIPVPYGDIFIWNNNLENLGFTKACNEGIRFGVNNGYDVIWLLNNDTEVVDIDSTVSALETEFKDHPNTAIVGFKILSQADPDFIHHGGTGACFPAGVHKIGRVSLGQLDQRTKEHWVTGASFAITSGCVLEIGVMDEKMVNYGSDSDYCFRARYVGLDVVYLPLPILHKIGQSQNPDPKQQRVIKSDMLQFYTKWITGKVYQDLDAEQLL